MTQGEPAAVRFDIRRYSREAVLHSHPHHQIVLPIAGRLEMEIAGHGGAVTAERAALIAAGQEHSFAGSADNAFLIVDLVDTAGRLPRSRDPLWRAARPRPFVALDRPLRGLCAFLAGEVERQAPSGSRALLAGTLLLDSLAERLGLRETGGAPALSRAIDFMQRHLDAPLTVAALAQAAGVSTSRLHAQFRARFGIGPMGYLTKRRMARAASLLEYSLLPISAIALAVGYSDQSAFTRAFRRGFGIAPARYRAAALRQEDRHKIQ